MEKNDPRLGKWARSAATYSELSQDFNTYRLSNHALIRGARLAPGMKIVDLGCGTGETTLAGFRAQPDLLHVWAVDPVGEMLERARRALRGRPVSFVHAAGASFSGALGGERVDRVLSNAAFFQFDDRRRVLAGIRDVLLPGGLFGFTLPGPNDGPGRFDLAGAVTDLLSSRRRVLPRRPTASRGPRHAQVACHYTTVRRILERAGFEVLSSEFFGYQASPEEQVSWMLLPAFRPSEWDAVADETLREAVLHVLAGAPAATTFSWNLIFARPERQP